jgi:hypothetical protein
MVVEEGGAVKLPPISIEIAVNAVPARGYPAKGLP